MPSVNGRRKILRVVVELGMRRAKTGTRALSSAPSRDIADAMSGWPQHLAIPRRMSDVCGVENGLVASPMQLLLMAH